ncbi:TldD/PmbA family protein [Tepidiforma sp.]|uniref:TldD/PmbA family protein n=1 Tax=Tepidiforma sp. TaxID=2682230 RepID=UPI002ADD8545|nr:TldD/PmbA family protein [Tepidiforma sp.]
MTSRLAEGISALELARRAVQLARRAGAEQCDAIVIAASESDVTVRLGEVEKLIEAGSLGLGLRVISGGRTAVGSTSDLSPAALEQFARETVELAAISAPDEYAGLPEPALLARDVSASAVGLYDERIEALSPDEKIRIARACEAAALAADRRVTNTDGASLSTRVADIALANSHGFEGTYPATSISLVVEAIADDAEGKKRNGYWYTAERSLSRLLPPEEVGRIAARRAVDQLGARKVPTTRVPVVFEPMTAVSLLGHLAGCATGDALYRGATFLASREGRQLASPLVTIVDDPTIPGRFGTRPFDGEGVATRPNPLVETGLFRGFLLDCYTARRLGRTTTGSAHRGLESPPSPGASNLLWQPGDLDPSAIIAGIERGLYVTSLMGAGFNPATGDYSRGAAGFWIEHGRLAYPVTEVNISGNLAGMLAAVDAVGSDLTWFGSAAAPTVRISEMTVSGL